MSVFEAMWQALGLNLWALAALLLTGLLIARAAARRWGRPFPAVAVAVLGGLGYLTATMVPAIFASASYTGVHCVLRPDIAAAFSAGGGGLVNLLLMVPLGAGLGMLGWRLPLAAITLAATAAGAEIIQATVPSQGSSCDTTDALLNVAGGLLAWSAVQLAASAHRRRAGSQEADGTVAEAGPGGQ